MVNPDAVKSMLTQLWYSTLHNQNTNLIRQGRLVSGEKVYFSFSSSDESFKQYPDMILLGYGYTEN